MMQKNKEYQTKYCNFLILMQLPFYALATSMVYKKFCYNFAEHLTLQTFTTAVYGNKHIAYAKHFYNRQNDRHNDFPNGFCNHQFSNRCFHAIF